jgi:hypothetical protein
MGKSISELFKKIFLFLIGVLSLLISFVYSSNLITAIKLDWYILIHPSKWFDLKLDLALPFLNFFIFASFLSSIYIFLIIVEELNNNRKAIKKIISILLLIILLVVAPTIFDLIQKSIIKNILDYQHKLFLVQGLQNKYLEWQIKQVEFIIKNFTDNDSTFNKEIFYLYYKKTVRDTMILSYFDKNEINRYLSNNEMNSTHWESYYSTLMDYFNKSDRKYVYDNYNRNNSKYEFYIEYIEFKGVLLKIKNPPGTVQSFDIKEDSGEKINKKYNKKPSVISMLDNNLDGIPDLYYIEETFKEIDNKDFLEKELLDVKDPENKNPYILYSSWIHHFYMIQ